MTIATLAAELRDAVNRAPDGERVVNIHLFGIRRAQDLDGISLKEIVRLAGIPSSYHTEIHKGMRLADYVILK
jgi:5-methylcytosine-specific restriction protein B